MRSIRSPVNNKYSHIISSMEGSSMPSPGVPKLRCAALGSAKLHSIGKTPCASRYLAA